MKRSVEQLLFEYHEWVKKTFPGETVERQTEHFKEEVKEWLDKPDDPLEAADVLMLFLSICKQYTIDPFEAWELKFEINRRRA